MDFLLSLMYEEIYTINNLNFASKKLYLFTKEIERKLSYIYSPTTVSRMSLIRQNDEAVIDTIDKVEEDIFNFKKDNDEFTIKETVDGAFIEEFPAIYYFLNESDDIFNKYCEYFDDGDEDLAPDEIKQRIAFLGFNLWKIGIVQPDLPKFF